MAIVHDVLHCAQHCNQHVGDVWMMTMFAICGRALVVLAAAAVVAYKSLLAQSATTETTSLELMPCSTEHSGGAPSIAPPVSRAGLRAVRMAEAAMREGGRAAMEG